MLDKLRKAQKRIQGAKRALSDIPDSDIRQVVEHLQRLSDTITAFNRQAVIQPAKEKNISFDSKGNGAYIVQRAVNGQIFRKSFSIAKYRSAAKALAAAREFRNAIEEVVICDEKTS